MQTATNVAAAEAETYSGPFSPELVLVTPELRELALQKLVLPGEPNGVKAHSDLLRLARERDDLNREREAKEPSLLRVAADAALRTSVMAVAFLLAVGGTSFGLTIAADGDQPRLVTAAKPPARFAVSPAVGTAAVYLPVLRSNDRAAGSRDHWRAGSLELRLSKRENALGEPGGSPSR